MSKHRNIAAGSRVHTSGNMSVRVCVAGLVLNCALVAMSSGATQADAVVTNIKVGIDPTSVAINPAGTFAYVTNNGGPINSGNVSKINLATDTVSTITVGSGPTGVAINPSGTFAYVANNMSGTVSKIDLSTDLVVATISVETYPYGVAINADGTYAYVTTSNSNGSGSVLKVDLATNSVVATISVGEIPRSIVINPAGTFAYVANNMSSTVSKIYLATDSVNAKVQVGTGLYGLAINPAGTFAYVTKTGGSASSAVSKIALTATDPQSITFKALDTQLLSVKTVALSATASSTQAVVFTSATPTICTVSGSTVTLVTVGECTIDANQAGGSGFDAAPQVSKTFTILPTPVVPPSPPTGEVGVSINMGDSYSNTKNVTLNLVWPARATAVRISNDGGFAASSTQTKELTASIDWVLDDSVKGLFTKVVYVRFNGVADTTKTYTDDIILDTTAPVVESSSASAALGSIELILKATDDITGVDKVEIKNGSTIVTRAYSPKVSVSEKEIGLSVSSSGVRKFAVTSVQIRVNDKAGNWSSFQTLSLSIAAALPRVTLTKSATAKSIAVFAKLKVLSTSKTSLKVVSSSAKYCKVSGATLKGLKVGSCKVTVTVTPKKGRAVSKTVTLKVAK